MHYITVTSTDRDGFVSGVDDHGRLRSAGLNRGAIIAVEAELERQRIDEDLPLGTSRGVALTTPSCGGARAEVNEILKT